MASNHRLIRVSPQQAFDYLSDLPRHNEWAIHPGLRVEQVEPGPVGVGTTYASHGRQLGQTLDDALVVTEYEPPRRFAFESRGRGGIFRHAFTIEAAPGGCVVTKEMEPLQMPHGMGLFLPLTQLILKQRMGRDLQRIARKLEA